MQLLSENAIEVFSDDIYIIRIDVFGCSKDDLCYYIVQEFASKFTFIKVYELEILESTEHLYNVSKEMIDITKNANLIINVHAKNVFAKRELRIIKINTGL